MKVIILNGKRMGITVIIIGLMLILVGLEKGFDGRLKFVALLQSNITSLKEYEGLNKSFTYKLPSDWNTTMQDFKGLEIVYHNDFVSEDSIIHGFVQVWDLKEDLKEFLDNSKNIAGKENKYKDYSISEMKINDKNGYLVKYSVMAGQNTYYKGYEYFFRNKGKFYRFSFFVREQNFKENMPTIFKTIVETLKYKD